MLGGQTEGAGFPIPEENDECEVELPKESKNKWLEILDEKGRIPYIYYPVVCAKCGEINPEFFRVSDKVWKKYVQSNMRDEVDRDLRIGPLRA